MLGIRLVDRPLISVEPTGKAMFEWSRADDRPWQRLQRLCAQRTKLPSKTALSRNQMPPTWRYPTAICYTSTLAQVLMELIFHSPMPSPQILNQYGLNFWSLVLDCRDNICTLQSRSELDSNFVMPRSSNYKVKYHARPSTWCGIVVL